MKEIFSFDVRLKDLMNLGEQAQTFGKLKALFAILKRSWYSLEDKAAEEERWNRIRIGSVEVFLDDSGALHMDFVTRYSFAQNSRAIELLALLPDDIELPDDFLQE